MTTRRYTSGGGGNSGMTLSFPPFTRVVKWIIGINVVLFFVHGVLQMVPSAALAAQYMERGLLLVPRLVVHGWIWQPVTYSFANFGLLQLIFGMLVIWLLGSNLESTFGSRWLIRYYAISALGGALCTIALAYSGLIASAPEMALGGVASVYLGFLIAYGVLFAETEFFLFPLPIQMKAKYLAGVTILISILLAVTGPGGLLSLGQLGGLIAGFVYIKFFFDRKPARTSGYAGRGLSDRYDRNSDLRKKGASEGLFARMKNSYYRWKRKRAARKFEVYMRDHNRVVKFDEYGNYIPPAGEEKSKKEDRGGWVN